MNAHTAIALPLTVRDIVNEYEAKAAALDSEIAAFKEAHTAMTMAATVMGTYVEMVVQTPSLHDTHLRQLLLQSGWEAVSRRLMIDHLATADDRKRLKLSMASPPPLTVENAKATFGDYMIRPRFHVLRGLAEVFTQLDPAYKSHSNVRIGVKGLPKRIILNGWGEYSYGTARDRFRDMVNALAMLRVQPRYDHGEGTAIELAHRDGEDAVLDGRSYFEADRYRPNERKEFKTVDRGITVRRFQNGNVHVLFDKWALFDINKALGEFYGEVLPDAEPENVKPSASTAVSKDLQFYWSPPAVVAAALDYANIYERDRWTKGDPPKVLEPSCGDGRILDELRKRGCRSIGIEYHPVRAAEARAKGHSVMTGNFLEVRPDPTFDVVVMNSPFAGQHWQKHVSHALKFLRPGGKLVAVLPYSARESGAIKGEWHDLPVASFADAGTNVATGLLRIKLRE